MTVKTSISLTDAQSAYAKKLVEEGRYASVSAVLQNGLEMLRQDREQRVAETEAFKRFLEARMEGSFVSMEQHKDDVEDIIATKRKQYGV